MPKFNLLCLLAVLAFAFDPAEGYCQPDESCWPSKDAIDAFAASLSSGGEDDCFKDLPTFSSADQQGDPVTNEWYSDQPAVLTPYLLLNLKTYVSEGLAYFVVLARNEADISKSVLFAAEHNIAVSVMSTGHEFQDRNAGPGPNSLLIRTTCLRSVQFDLDPENQFGHMDGTAKLGAGLTWGFSKFNMKGAQQYARDVGRMFVSGHAPNVGIVGWSVGGGHGQLVPMLGMGADQILEVDLVSADGSFVTANAEGTRTRSPDGLRSTFTKNSDLFWAIRGGGGSTWGVIYALTVKAHRARNDCQTKCFTEKTKLWGNIFTLDDALMAVDIAHSYLKWAAQASRYWSSYANLIVGSNGDYAVSIGALYAGREEDDSSDFQSFDEWFKEVYPNNLLESTEKKFDTFLDKLLSQDSTIETVFTTFPWFNMLSVLLNETMTNNPDVAKNLVDNWIPRCYRQSTPCYSTLQFVHCMPNPYYQAEGFQNTSISDALKEARMHIYIGDIISLQGELTFDQKSTFIHETLAPLFYQAGEGSYFSESEYTMSDWKNRFWGSETFSKLSSVKKAWDPAKVFGCRHCIGDEN